MMLHTYGLRLTITGEADHWTMFVTGELDIAREADLVDVAKVLAERRLAHILIDLDHVSFVDSAGYRSIHRAADILRASGATVTVVNPSRAVTSLERALESAFGLEAVFDGVPAWWDRDAS